MLCGYEESEGCFTKVTVISTLKEETKQQHLIKWPLIIVEDVHEHTRMHHPSILLTSMLTSLSKVV